MGTTTEKLQAILNSKAAIKAAIEGKGVENVGDVLSTYADAISSIPTGGRGWTGHADVEGLKAIGWTDEDIAYYQEHGVNWNEEDDPYHLVPEDNKALYGIINIDNIQDYKDILVYLPKIDTSSVTSMNYMFQNCFALVSVPLFDTSSVTNMDCMFQNCFALVSVPLFDTSKVSSMIAMFQSCYSLVSVPLFDTSKVSSMYVMFESCTSLAYCPLFNTINVTNMYSMFHICHSLKSIPAFDTSNVNRMPYMFQNCNNIVHIPPIDVSKVTIFTNTFNLAYKLQSCNLKNLKLSIDISATSLLEKSSLLYMIENAAPTDAITITLSAYCYNKFSNDPDVVAALSAQPLVSLASAA